LLAIAPWQLSGFWVASYDYLPQALFSGMTAMACVLMALRPRFGITNPANKKKLSRAAWCMVAFSGWLLLSSVTTVYQHDTVLELARVGNCIAWFFMVRALLFEGGHTGSWGWFFERRVLMLMAAVMVSALPVVIPMIIGFIQTRTPQLSLNFYNNNLYANFCAMAIPITCALGLLARRVALASGGASVALGLGIGSSLIIGVGLVVSASKGGLLATMAGLLALSVLLLRARRAQVGKVVHRNRVAVIIAVLLLLVVGGAVAQRTVLPRLMAARGSENHSTMFRVYTWRGTTDMIKARPLLGFGPGSFPSAYPQYAQAGFTRSAHQSWLQVAAESGVPALLLLLGACGVALHNGWRATRGAHWPVASGAGGALVAFAVHGLTDAGWGITSILFLLMVVLAILDTLAAELVVAKNGQDAHEIGSSAGARGEASRNEGSRLRFEWLPVALLLAWGSVVAQKAQTGEDARAESRALTARGSSQMALQKAQEGVEADPLSVRMWTSLAQAQELTGGDTTASWQKAVDVRPTGAQTWLFWAEAKERRGESPREQFDRAVALDPNDTSIRWARAQWLLAQGDPAMQQQGWSDLEKIEQLLEAPYGRYPATPEIVNLDFVRALLKLAERETEAGSDRIQQARARIGRAANLLATARKYEAQRRALMSAMTGSGVELEQPEDLDDLEARLNNLRERLQK
jgi:O-antigen ligase